jgi:preprotein translocase subunit SecG
MLTVTWFLTCTSCSETNLVRSGLGLTEVPPWLQENIIELDLSNNSITTVNRDDLGKLKRTKTIDMSYNEIEAVHANAFEYVGDLETLNLSYNNIFTLSAQIFLGNKKLKKVDLNNNKLQVTRNSLLSEHILESTSLNYLDVSFCNITSISIETFSGLPNLETLKMNGNPLIQFDVESIRPLNNLKIMHMQIFNSSAFEKFCNNFVNDRKLTLSPSCPSASSSRLADSEETELNIITASTIICACAFFITVVIYVLLVRCKTRKAKVGDKEKQDSEKTVVQRQLPQPPDPNEGYEIPVSPRYRWLSSIYHTRRVKRKTGYSSVPLENTEEEEEEEEGRRKAISDKDKNPGLQHSLPCKTVYPGDIHYSEHIEIYSHLESDEDGDYKTVMRETEISSVQNSPQLPEQHRSSHVCTKFSAGVSSQSPPDETQMIASGSPLRHSERQNTPLPLVPVLPNCVYEEPLIPNTKSCVDGPEKVFVSSTTIEIGKYS